MSSNESLGQSALPIQHRLDIVQDCADLEGTFPANVELKFVFWTHGVEVDDGEMRWLNPNRRAYQDPIEALAPHLLDADVVGLECPNYLGREGVFSEDEAYDDFKKINSMIRGEHPGKTVAEVFGRTEGNGSIHEIVDILQEVAAVAPPQFRLPQFVPLDDMSGSIDVVDRAAYGEDVEQYYGDQSTWIRSREEVVLRQLQELATFLGKDGRQHQVAVIYGSMHSLLSVAARVLGAPVSRTFISRRFAVETAEVRFLSRLTRFEQDPGEIEKQLQTIRDANEEGITTTKLLGRLGLVPETEGSKFSYVEKQIKDLLVVGRQGKLTPTQTANLDDSLIKLKYFFDDDKKKPLFFKERAEARAQAGAEEAGQRILDLSKELARLTFRRFIKYPPLSRQLEKEYLALLERTRQDIAWK